MSVHEYDLWRHSPIRYLGYANEVGEAFRYQISLKFLLGTYCISSFYIICDTIDKVIKLKHKQNKENKIDNVSLIKSSFLTLTWQLISTEILPGFFVFIVVKCAKNFKFSYIKQNNIRYWVPTIIGLCWIPFFPSFIDPSVDFLFDKLNLNIDKIH